MTSTGVWPGTLPSVHKNNDASGRRWAARDADCPRNSVATRFCAFQAA